MPERKLQPLKNRLAAERPGRRHNGGNEGENADETRAALQGRGCVQCGEAGENAKDHMIAAHAHEWEGIFCTGPDA